jgi:hypothetical protein
VGGICLPLASEEVSGDLWSMKSAGAESAILIADGLGHGSLANEASSEAVRVFDESRNHGLDRLFQSLQLALKKTRGAAVSALVYAKQARMIRFMGIGNVAGAVVGPGRASHMVCLSGIVGHDVRKLQEFTYAFPPGSLLVLHSDGLATKWDVESYPGLFNKHPSLIAAVLYHDFRRVRDDGTVGVAKETAA